MKQQTLSTSPSLDVRRQGPWQQALWWLGLALILLAAWGYRSLGRNWDETYGLHPDERFLAMVLSAIEPVSSLGQYFDTATSPLNPANKGFGFFVYGTLPLFLIRYAGEALGQRGYGEFMLLSRLFSALADLGTVFLVGWMARRLYGIRVGFLAAAFYAFSVMPIQQSHFGTVDNFLVLFLTLSLAMALGIQTLPGRLDNRAWPWFVGFGLAFGAAMASKVSAFPAAFLLPLALVLRWAMRPNRARREFPHAVVWTVVAAGVSFLTFRVAQPYAFTGPNFWNLGLHRGWLDNLAALKAQASGTADFPPAMQWARRPLTYGLVNYVRWGVGPALALLVVLAAGFMAWRWRRGEHIHGLVWIWGVGYFAWQSTIWNPTMRYFLPAYPALSVIAAWGLEVLLRHPRRRWRGLARVAGLLVLGGTAAWAWAFVQIYTRPHTRMAASRWIFQNIPGPVNLVLETPAGARQEPLPVPPDVTLGPEDPLVLPFRPSVSGVLNEVFLYRVEHLTLEPAPASVLVEIRHVTAGEDAPPLAQSQGSLLPPQDPRYPPTPVRLVFQEPPSLQAGETYILTLRVEQGRYRLVGATIANESSWDDGLPLRIDGYDPYGGLYEGLNLELYWDDNEDKRQRFYAILDRADVILITSSRQWGSLPRLPERYPLVTAYYYDLLGCPRAWTIERCYNSAQPGDFQGLLGFELVAVFQSDPTLGPWRINDQPADEAFTVYDHPKVFVFRKTAAYDPDRVRTLLGAVDLRYVQRTLPGEAPPHPTNLLLPPDRWYRARQEGTWRDLFPPENPLNRSQGLALVVWYVFIAFLGWVAWPYLYPLFQGMVHGGYPWTRIAGMLLWAWLVWMGSAWGVPVTRSVLWAGLGILALGAMALTWVQRATFLDWLRSSRRLILRWEGWFLLFFALDLFIRVMNPDLWHPARGGERPMELSYLHAVLKGTTFPPYDPWFAGGYMNYYYWGFVLVGFPMKALGLRTEVAFNLVLPTLFAATGVGVMGLVTVLYRAVPRWHREGYAEGVGLLGGLLAVVIGNLGTVKMFWEGFQNLGAGRPIDVLSFPERVWYALVGLGLWLRGAKLPYHLGEWYWNPSRIIPAPGDVPPITEFPFFSFLYGDLHPHLIAFAVTVLAMAWAWAVIAEPRRLTRWPWILVSLFWGALIVGSLRPINTWDFPTYLLLGVVALVYASWVAGEGRPGYRRGFMGLMLAFALFLLARLLWKPYIDWYAQGYNEVDPWRGPKTPLTAYLWHWGTFLFLLATWGGWALYRWARSTPALPFLLWWRRFGPWVWAALITMALVGLVLWMGFQVVVAVVVLPLLALMGVFMVFPQVPHAVRFVALLAAMALGLTVLVEVVVLRGDIGRMNMVFKFYLQAWLLLSVAVGTMTGWLMTAGLPRWRPGWRQVWLGVGGSLFLGALAYTVMASSAKMKDRWVLEAPRGLDGMAYMGQAVYHDQGQPIPLDEDYRAIQWMRRYVQGSPVIVEVNTPEYRWGSRYTIYTGLPGVVGWNWHQRQQRGVVTPPEWVTQRVAEVAQFYTTTDRAWVVDFLRRYRVAYIVVGRLEKAYHPGPGLEKFPAWTGDLWEPVYQNGETTIYRVLPWAVYGVEFIP